MAKETAGSGTTTGNVGTTGGNAPRRRWGRLAVSLLVLAVALAGLLAAIWMGKPALTPANAEPAPDSPPELASLEAMEQGFTWIAETVKPAVVFIEVEQRMTRAEPDEMGPDAFGTPERWWREFFGPNLPMPRWQQPIPQVPRIGQGSGVIIGRDGYIVTNNHVIDDAESVTVHLSDGKSYPAEVMGTDELTDLAVIKIDADRDLPTVVLGDADETKVGSWAMAVGFAFGGARGEGTDMRSGRFDEGLRFEPTVTVGVVSAKERQLQSEMEGRPFRDLIQTDAPINPGNSGGPLVNIRAEVIGINQAIFTSGFVAGNIGVGFAIPINAHTKQIIESLKGGEPVVRGQLGIAVRPLTPTLKSVYEADNGVFIQEVMPDTPAERAGMKAEDIIVRMEGEEVESVDGFVNSIQMTKPGTTVTMDIIRDGKPMSLKVTVEALTLDVAKAERAEAEATPLGLTVETLPPEVAEEAGLSGGVRVRRVEPLSDGARAGIRRGDIILKINRKPVDDLKSYGRIVKELKAGEPVAIRVWRSGRTITAEIDRLSE